MSDGVIFANARRWPRTDLGRLIDVLDRLHRVRAEQPRDLEVWL